VTNGPRQLCFDDPRNFLKDFADWSKNSSLFFYGAISLYLLLVNADIYLTHGIKIVVFCVFKENLRFRAVKIIVLTIQLCISILILIVQHFR